MHTADLAVVVDVAADVPAAAAGQALHLITELAVGGSMAGSLLRVATGRPTPISDFSVL